MSLNMENLKKRGVSMLHWLEKYTKTDMVYLAHGSFWLGLGQIVASGSALLTSIAFANLLSPDVFGIYKYILSISSIIAITTLTGMDSAVTQAVARGYDGTLLPAVKEKMKWGSLGSLFSFLIGAYYYTQGNLTLSIAFCIVAIFMPFAEAFDMYNSLLWGKKKFDTQTKYNIIRKIFTLVLTLGTLFLTKNIFIILAVYFITIVIPAGFFLYRTIKKNLNNHDQDPETIRYGKHLSLIHIIGLLLGELDKILIFHYLGAANLAVYSLAIAPNDQIKGLLKNVNSLAMPQLSNKTTQEIRESIWHKIWILGLVTGIIVLFYILIAPTFFSLFFPKYLSAVSYSQILSISLIPVVMAGFIYTALESQKDKDGIYKYNLYNNIFSIIILIPFVYYLGIWGAIFSRFTSRLFLFALASRLVKNMS
jgi:O-antigen/teichoic acid export membrane protein